MLPWTLEIEQPWAQPAWNAVVIASHPSSPTTRTFFNTLQPYNTAWQRSSGRLSVPRCMQHATSGSISHNSNKYNNKAAPILAVSPQLCQE